MRERRFDTENGVDTEGYVSLGAEGEGVLYEHGHPYLGSPHSAVRDLIAELPIEHTEFTFVDLGCGKGRVMLVASEFEFTRIVGIELAEGLAAAARHNVRRFRGRRQRCFQIEVEQGDATTWPIPDEPTVLYLYNSFGGPLIDRFMCHLEETLRDRTQPLVVVLFDSPPFHQRFAECAHFTLLSAGPEYHVYGSQPLHG